MVVPRLLDSHLHHSPAVWFDDDRDNLVSQNSNLELLTQRRGKCQHPLGVVAPVFVCDGLEDVSGLTHFLQEVGDSGFGHPYFRAIRAGELHFLLNGFPGPLMLPPVLDPKDDRPIIVGVGRDLVRDPVELAVRALPDTDFHQLLPGVGDESRVFGVTLFVGHRVPADRNFDGGGDGGERQCETGDADCKDLLHDFVGFSAFRSDYTGWVLGRCGPVETN